MKQFGTFFRQSRIKRHLRKRYWWLNNLIDAVGVILGLMALGLILLVLIPGRPTSPTYNYG